MSDEPGFMTDAAGPAGISGVFEDVSETGYLYLYEPQGHGIFGHLHIYNRSSEVVVNERDVRVIWSDDLSKVGVVIWGRMRGIFHVESGRVLRIPITSPD